MPAWLDRYRIWQGKDDPEGELKLRSMPPEEFNVTRQGLIRRIRHVYGVAYPSSLQFELTSYCNATCQFCAHSWSKRPEKHMSPELFRKMIDEVHSWALQPDIIYLMGLGEPLMHPNWRSLYDYARGLPAAITTNCSLLNEENTKFLLNLGFYELAFSLDTLNPERHQRIRGFDVCRVAPKIVDAFSLAREMQTKTRMIVSTTLTLETAGDMRAIYDWLVPQLEGLENSFWHIKQIGYFPDVKMPVQIIPAVTLPAHPKVIVINGPTLLRPTCTLWFDRVNVLSDGSVVPCCHQAHDHNRIGNVNSSTILELFNSAIWQESQDRFTLKDEPGGWNEIPYCKDCR